MNAKTKFFKMYYKLPEKARYELVVSFFIKGEVIRKSLYALANEIKHDTDLGKKALPVLGFCDVGE
jgi:hypothetical protein